MKKTIFLFAAVAGFALSARGTVSTFAKHNVEVHVTPSADYHLWQSGDLLVNEPYETTYPFIGFGFGANYIFRPIKVVGVSTGLNFKMQGGFTRIRTFPPFQSSFVSFKGNHHLMYITIPVYIHLYKEMTNSTFEFAVGPDFNIPIFYRSAGSAFDSNGEKTLTSKDSEKLTAKESRDFASFGLSIFLGGEMHIFENGNMFIGPQIQFLNLVSFNKDLRDIEKENGKFFDVSLGLKVGFRFHK